MNYKAKVQELEARLERYETHVDHYRDLFRLYMKFKRDLKSYGGSLTVEELRKHIVSAARECYRVMSMYRKLYDEVWQEYDTYQMYLDADKDMELDAQASFEDVMKELGKY